MNQKGFTLVELLATVVILSVVMGIASYGVISIINTSRKNTEKVFVDRIAGYIDEYLALKSSGFKFDSVGYCVNNDCSNEAYRVVSDSFISLNDLVDSGIVDADKMINPVNKKNCLSDGKNPSIFIYCDSRFVYYYYVDLSGSNTSCDISEDNDLIYKMPNDLIADLNNKGVNLPSHLKHEAGIS